MGGGGGGGGGGSVGPPTPHFTITQPPGAMRDIVLGGLCRYNRRVYRKRFRHGRERTETMFGDHFSGPPRSENECPRYLGYVHT